VPVQNIQSSKQLSELKTSESRALEYNVSFSQFTPSQVSQIQKFMRAYSGFEAEKVLSQNATNMNMLYVSSAGKEMLSNNIQKTAQHLGFQILLRTANQNIDIRFVKLNTNNLPYKEW
jgi:hypothetical protein